MIANETLDAYIIAKDSADRRLHGFHNLGRHFILNGTTEVWFTVSDDYEVGHVAMVSQLERLRVKSALTATLALLPGELKFFGPYGYLNGCRALTEDTWELENDPIENNDEYFSIPLYAKVDVLFPVSAAATVPHSDDQAVDRFAAAMKAKLAKKRAEGYGGWDNPKECSLAYLGQLLVKHIEKGDPVDICNFAMMIHQRAMKEHVRD